MRWAAMRQRWAHRASNADPPMVVANPPDLTGNEDVTLALLDDDAWRSRAVERISIASARVAQAHRSLQVAPLRELIAPLRGDPTSARVLLPLHEMPKGPLLDFDLYVDGKPGYLAKRSVTAEIEAAHVAMLARRDGVQLDDITVQFVAAICEFTPTIWREVRKHRRRKKAHQRYLAMGLRPLNINQAEEETPEPGKIARGLLRLAAWLVRRFPTLPTHARWVDRPSDVPIELPRGAYEHWSHHAQKIARLLAFALHEGRDDSSSADDPLLAVPLLAERAPVSTVEDVTRALVALDNAVEALRVAAGGDPSKSAALRTLAAYGRRWMALVWCEVPLDRPFLVSSSQEIAITINRTRWLTIGPLPLADAASNHLALHVKDGNVELAKPNVYGLDGKHLTHTLASGLRKSREGFAIYSSENPRDRRVQLRLRLRVSRGISLIGLLVQAIVWVAVAVSYYQMRQHTLTPADLAVLVVPTTFAASLLLTRERNSLARRLQVLGRTMTAIAMVALWTGVAYAYFSHDLHA